MMITVELPRDALGNVTTHNVEVPALPRVGDYLSHDKLHFRGGVQGVHFWWDEDGKFIIAVKLR